MKILETHIVPAITEKVRLQEYAFSIFNTIQTRSALKKAIKKGLILIDGKKAETGNWIQEGQAIHLVQSDGASKKIFRLNFKVLFEDAHLAVIQKPAGYPTSGNFFKTIENALPHNLKKSLEPDALEYPLPAHRLDNPTGGILLCAKTNSSLIQLQHSFANKTILKTYYAVVHGKTPATMDIDSFIEKKPATTLVKALKYFNINGDMYTLVEAKPLTGKTHQIRIHLGRKFHPIIGDKIYGKTETGYFEHKNLYLFSGGVHFKHPVTQDEMNFSIAIPKKFRNLSNYRVY